MLKHRRIWIVIQYNLWIVDFFLRILNYIDTSEIINKANFSLFYLLKKIVLTMTCWNIGSSRSHFTFFGSFSQDICARFGTMYKYVLARTSLSGSFGINRCTVERTGYNIYDWCCWLYNIQHLLRSVFNVYNFNFNLIN